MFLRTLKQRDPGNKMQRGDFKDNSKGSLVFGEKFFFSNTFLFFLSFRIDFLLIFKTHFFPAKELEEQAENNGRI